MDRGFTFTAVLAFCAFMDSAAVDSCQPFPSGQITHDTSSDIMPDDIIQHVFNISLNLSKTVLRVDVNFTAMSLKFSVNDSTSSVSWRLTSANNSLLDRNSSWLSFSEARLADDVHSLTVFNPAAGEDVTLQGSMDLVLTDGASAGDLVQSTLEVTVTYPDNSTCFTSIDSPYFYLPPPKLWVSSDTPLPIPMMQQYQGVVNLLVNDPYSLGPAAIEVRTPSESSSREVILTIQTSSIDHMTGFTHATTEKVLKEPLLKRSTFGSFQNDIAQFNLPTLHRDSVNFSRGDLGIKFSARAEDYSQLRDQDTANVSVAVTFGRSDDVRGRGGANLIWVSSLAATLQAPPLELKRPELNLTLNQRASCAFDGETRAIVDVDLFHMETSTATAYNVTARVYLTDAMKLMRHSNSEIRQNSLTLTQRNSVLYVDIERMTFSDPLTVTLTLDVDLSQSQARFASYHVITADAIFADRWGNSSGMFTAIDYVSLRLDSKCSQRVNWIESESCACAHNVTRTDCACCVSGACQCGDINPHMCQPCDRLHLCQPYLKGVNAITELDMGDSLTTFVCDTHQRYSAWSKGISCYKRSYSAGTYAWTPINPVVGSITARDVSFGTLYGVSNNGLAHMRSEDGGTTWYTVPESYVPKMSDESMVEAKIITAGLED